MLLNIFVGCNKSCGKASRRMLDGMVYKTHTLLSLGRVEVLGLIPQLNKLFPGFELVIS
ncbi:hypothetical protein Lalb_Chr08g0246861 [Lupinus albus]|uniref:Uncharacterized protein n=1 Tax=Lupinus albus TaxID=3870 RepID=A0A6A4Q6D1_LUPAL|nr:hypothetical protein Lalb_Chr08g0246861 [Lupinus albus]